MSTRQQWEGKMLSGVWKKSVNIEIEKLGIDGWELVAVLPGKEDRRELYFKRPKLPVESSGNAATKGKPTYKFTDDLRKAFREGLEEE
ncbi:uncharacterized protein METZ01_LOCUS408159 [marine metagenome]|uniref:DUF4177 domain-containing protein n=1 Tax=marine metagenome TaxID=408172 RepID=A0A382WAC0_9ZZZZ